MKRTIQLAPNHDIESLAAAFAKDRRLQIRNFFAEEDAERIYTMLDTQTPWWTAFNEGPKVTQLPPEQIASLSREQSAQLLAGIYERARREYQFLYQYYPMFSRYFTPGTPWLPIYEIYEALNSPEMIAFFRKLTGRDDIVWADGHATLYRAGHFLKYHTDEQEEDERIAAYVLNFTKGWGRDWGGFLQFFNSEYDVELALRPVFNALNIFLIPADHSVGMVASYAPGLRYSVTGWLRGDEPPGAFDRRGR